MQVSFEFRIKRAVINPQNLDLKTQKLMNNCIELCQKHKNKDAIKLIMPYIYFECNWQNGDGDPQDVFPDPQSIFFRCNRKNCNIRLGVDSGKLIITAAVRFSLEVRNGIEINFLNDWIYKNSMDYCGSISGEWHYEEIDEVSLSVIDNDVSPAP